MGIHIEFMYPTDKNRTGTVRNACSGQNRNYNEVHHFSTQRLWKVNHLVVRGV